MKATNQRSKRPKHDRVTVSVRLDRETLRRLHRFAAEENLRATCAGGEVKTLPARIREAVERYLGEQR